MNHKSLLWIPNLLMLTFATVQQTSAQPPVGAAGASGGDGEASALDEIVVTGSRYAQQRAVERKNSAFNILDATSADDLGRLPDRNIGDALSRLPGVSTDQFEGEARFINIRGLDSSLNNLTLDGFNITTDDARGRDGRSAALDGISTSGIGMIEVAKTLTPDMDGVGIGGAVNLITPSAFDRSESSFGFTVDTSYSELSDNNAFDWSNFQIYGSTVLGADDQFGIFVSLDRMVRDVLIRDFIEEIGRPGPGELPDSISFDRLPTKRERTNLSANLQWRISENSEVYLRGRFGENNRDITTRATQSYSVRGDATAAEGDTYLVPLQLTLENEERLQRNESIHLTLGASLAPTEALELEASVAWSDSEARRPLWSKIRARSDNFPGLLEAGRQVTMRPVEPGLIDDPASFELNRVRLDGNDNDEDVFVPRVDATWRTSVASRSVTLKTGLKASLRDKFVDGKSDRFEPNQAISLADISGSTLPGPGSDEFPLGDTDFLFDDRSVSLTPNWPVLFNFFENNPEMFDFQENGSLANSVEDDYVSKEDITAGYFMAQLEAGDAFWTGGIRIEHTDFDTSAFRFSELADGTLSIDPVSGSTSYTDYLLNLQLRYSLSEDLLVRAAFTQSIGRPDFSSAAPIQSFEVIEVDRDQDGNPIFTGNLDTGNPELDRFEADNLDFALEYYPSETGLFALSLFWKEIDNPIFNRRERVNDTTFAGFTLESLEIDSFENADSGRVRGIELTAQEQLRFLPSPLNNLAISANYTLVDSESDVLERAEELPFFGQADNIANVNLIYQQGGFEGRLAWRYRDETLASLGGNTNQDIFRDSYKQLDLKFGYRFNNGLFLFADAWNLTDETPETFRGDSSQLFGLEETGRWYTFGLQWSPNF